MNFDAILEDRGQDPAPTEPAYTPTQRAPFDLERAKKSFEPYGRKLAEVKAQAEALEVKDDQSASHATAIAGEVKRLGKAVEDRRKAITGEPNRFIKAVNGMAKMFTDPAAQIERLLKGKIGQYQTQKELERRKREEAMRKAQEELYRRQQQEAKAAHVEPPPPPAPIPVKEETVTRAETGAAAHIRREWKGTVVDPEQVPREYCSPDQKKINEAVKLGVREIAGVEIKEEVTTVIRS